MRTAHTVLPIFCCGSLLTAALVGPACNGGSDLAMPPDGGAGANNDDAAVPVAAPPPPPALIETLCTAHATTECARFSECMPFYFGMTYGTTALCLGREKLACALRLAAEGTRMGEGFMAGCTQAVATASCAAIVGGRITGAALPGCVAPTGAIAPGRPCGSNDQCTTGYCKRDGNCGVCAVRAAPGRSCAFRTDCQLGHLCQSGVCVIPSDENGSCATDLSCTGDLACIAGKCQRPLGPGSACDPDADKCALYSGVLCHPESLRCEPIELREPGRSCGYLGNDVIALCKDGGSCDIGLFENAGTCVPAAIDGETCGGADGACVQPALCLGVGVCGFPSINSCL